MRFSALLFLAALAGALVNAGEYGPHPAPHQSPDSPGLITSLHSSLSFPGLSWLLLPLQVTPAPRSPRTASLPHWSGGQESPGHAWSPGLSPHTPSFTHYAPTTLAFLQGFRATEYSWAGCPQHKGARLGVVGLKSSPHSILPSSEPCQWPCLSGCLFPRRTKKALFRPGQPRCSENTGTFLPALPSAGNFFPLSVLFPQPTLNVTCPMLSHLSNLSLDINSSKKPPMNMEEKLDPLSQHVGLAITRRLENYVLGWKLGQAGVFPLPQH